MIEHSSGKHGIPYLQVFHHLISLSKKIHFLFSSWREYFNLVLCEKKDLAARSQQIQLSQLLLSFRALGKFRLLLWSVLPSEPLKYQVIKSNRTLCLTVQTFLYSIKSFLMLTFSSNCIDFISRIWGFAVDCSLKCYRLVLSKDIRRLEKDGLPLQTGTENLPKILLGTSSSHLKPPWLWYLRVQVRQGSDFVLLFVHVVSSLLHFKVRNQSKPDYRDNWEYHILSAGGTITCSAFCETHKLKTQYFGHYKLFGLCRKYLDEILWSVTYRSADQKT